MSIFYEVWYKSEGTEWYIEDLEVLVVSKDEIKNYSVTLNDITQKLPIFFKKLTCNIHNKELTGNKKAYEIYIDGSDFSDSVLIVEQIKGWRTGKILLRDEWIQYCKEYELQPDFESEKMY